MKLSEDNIKNIKQKLYNISANLHADSYMAMRKRLKGKKVKSYVPSVEAEEALDMYKLAVKTDWNKEDEEKIKGYILKIVRIYDKDYTMDNSEYYKVYYNYNV